MKTRFQPQSTARRQWSRSPAANAALSSGAAGPPPSRLRAGLYGPGPARARMDLISALLALALAVTCLGSAVLFFTVTGQELHAGTPKLIRWMTMAFPVGTGLVFMFSFMQGTPWFAGVLAAALLWAFPFFSSWPQWAAFVVLSVVLGQVEAGVRERGAAIRRQGG